MAKYRLMEDIAKTKTVAILRDDGALIPLDERNRDYGIIYLFWLDGKDFEGVDMGTGKNIPDPAKVKIILNKFF